MKNPDATVYEPLISVLLPFYNAESTLPRAIQSIINQTFINWELVLINNVSTDTSVEKAKQFAHNDSRIVLIDELHKGVVNAFNTGLNFCKGEFIARMDADDFSLPERLNWQYHFMLENPDLDLTSGLVRHVSDNRDTRGYKIYVDWINNLISYDQIYLNQFIESPFANPSVMFTRKALLKYGGCLEGNFPEDYEMWLRWLSMGATCRKIEKEVLLWYDYPDRLSRNNGKYSKEAFNSIKIHYLDKWLRKFNPFFPDLVIWGAGKTGHKNAKLLEKLGHKINYFIDVSPKKTFKHNCISYNELPQAGTCFIVSFVGNRGASSLIKRELQSKGYKEGLSFIIAAGIE